MNVLRIPVARRAPRGARITLPANRLALLTAIAVVVALLLIFLPTPSSNSLFIALSAAVGALLILVALLSRRDARVTRLGVGLGYLLMIALLRQGEGGSASGFGGLFLVAVTFLAISGDRLDLAVGLVVMLLAQVIPIVVWGAPSYPSSGYRGAFVLTTAAAIAGATIQQLLVDLSKGVERDVLRRVVEGQEVERKRLARELHDETGQTLTSMLVGLKRLEESSGPGEREVVSSLRESVVGTMRGLRRIVVELRPQALDDLGLVPAVEALCASVSDANGLDVEFAAGEFPRLGAESETALYRIVQEGLTNVVRHAHAHRVDVRIESISDWVRLTIEDDGHGFDTRGEGAGFGLDGIRERVQLLGGVFDVVSTERTGTALVAEVPAT
ncbi:MAG TPA: sensor histidine kinase [Gaiellaceae bacterium]